MTGLRRDLPHMCSIPRVCPAAASGIIYRAGDFPVSHRLPKLDPHNPTQLAGLGVQRSTLFGQPFALVVSAGASRPDLFQANHGHDAGTYGRRFQGRITA